MYGASKQAIQFLRASLDIRKRLLPSEHLGLSQSYRNMGLAFAHLGNYKRAIRYHKLSLNITQRSPPTAQWSTVLTLQNMGDIYNWSGNISEARRCYSKAKDVYRECLNYFRQK